MEEITQEIEIATIVKRSITGVFALVSRTFLIQIISFVLNFLLTIFLTPSIFGVYYLVLAVISFLSYFSDIGLAAALVQKKDKPTEDDFKTVFTIQEGLVITICVITFISIPFISKFYNLNSDGSFLLEALIISFFLSSLKTIPSIILERDLHFDRLVIPEIIETIVFSSVSLIFAIKGFGIASFSWAVLARGISGVIAIYIIAPWKIGVKFSLKNAKNLLKFGVPFQINSFLGLIKDDLFLAFTGKILPIADIGYIGFAQKWAYAPLRLIMDNVIRITFPSFSRLQDSKENLKKALEKTFFALSFFIFPSAIVLILIFPNLIDIIPRYKKWEPAIFSLMLFSINAVFSSISTPLTNLFNALGKIKTSLKFMIFWTVATWTLTPVLIFTLGFNGFALASALISISSVGVYYVARKYVEFDLFKSIKYPLFASIISFLCTYGVSLLMHSGILRFITLLFVSGLTYLLSVSILGKNEFLQIIKVVRAQFKK